MPQSCDTIQFRITPIHRVIECLRLQSKSGDDEFVPEIISWQWGTGYVQNPNTYWDRQLVDCAGTLKSVRLEFIAPNEKIHFFASSNPLHRLVFGWAPDHHGKLTSSCVVRVRFRFPRHMEL